MWSGPLTSFQGEIEKKKEKKAYTLGVEASNSGKPMIGPFEAGSHANENWLDGYLDDAFLRSM